MKMQKFIMLVKKIPNKNMLKIKNIEKLVTIVII